MGLGQGRWLIRGRINSSEGVKLKVPWVFCKWISWGRWFEEEYLLEQTKYIPNVYPIVQSDLLGNSTDRDVNYERTGGMKAQKYLRESCYHHIECSVANSLAALMRKWSLNSVFQPYSYPRRLQKDADGTRINMSDLLSTCKVKIRKGR